MVRLLTDLIESQDFETIRIEHPDRGTAIVTLTRPDRLNALTATMIDELTAVVDAVDSSRTLRCVIVTGAGRGFCAGLDLGDAGNPADATDVGPVAQAFIRQDHIATLNERIHRCRKPWIAAVNGPCVGGGLALALTCDIRIASDAARFGAVFTTIGLSNCDMGSSYFLPRIVGAGRAAELLLTARIFESDEALSIGLVTDRVPAGDLLDRARHVAGRIASNPPFGTWMTKETMWQTIDAPSLRQALDIENRTQVMLVATDEIAEARTAFAERRPPRWRDL